MQAPDKIELTKQLQQEATVHLSKVSRGVIHIEELKGFLSRVANYRPVKKSRKADLNMYEDWDLSSRRKRKSA